MNILEHYIYVIFFIRKRLKKQVKPLCNSLDHEYCRKGANNFRCLKLHYTECNARMSSSLAVLSSEPISLIPQAAQLSATQTKLLL